MEYWSIDKRNQAVMHYSSTPALQYSNPTDAAAKNVSI